MAVRWYCGECGNRLHNRKVRICPTCGRTLQD